MKINISFSGSVNLSKDEVWPDGDAPESPTDKDIKAKLEACGSKTKFIKDWGLSPYLIINVEVHEGDDQ